jgi:hypothetical protein
MSFSKKMIYRMRKVGVDRAGKTEPFPKEDQTSPCGRKDVELNKIPYFFVDFRGRIF